MNNDIAADAYYNDDNLDKADSDIDLSFLDEEEQE